MTTKDLGASQCEMHIGRFVPPVEQGARVVPSLVQQNQLGDAGERTQWVKREFRVRVGERNLVLEAQSLQVATRTYAVFRALGHCPADCSDVFIGL